MHAQAQKKMYKVLVPIEKKGGGKTYWMRVGTGFTAKDQTSLNLIIDAVPIGVNKFHVRELDEEDLQRRDQRGNGRNDNTLLPSAETGDIPF